MFKLYIDLKGPNEAAQFADAIANGPFSQDVKDQVAKSTNMAIEAAEVSKVAAEKAKRAANAAKVILNNLLFYPKFAFPTSAVSMA